MIRTVTIARHLPDGTIATGDDQLVLTLANPEISQGFAIVSMSGLGPEKATLNSTEWATIDGGTVNSTHIPMRQILMELKFVPTAYDETVADIRRKSYLYFPLKKKVRVTFDMYDLRHGHRRYWIDGYVEENTPSIWSDQEGCNIALKCEDPAFKNVEETYVSFSQIRGVFHMAVDEHDKPIAFPDDDMASYPTKEIVQLLPSEGEANTLYLIYDSNAKRYSGYSWCEGTWVLSAKPLGSGESFWPIAEILNYEELDVENLSTLNVGVKFVLRARSGQVVNPFIYNRTTGERMVINKTLTPGECIIIDTREGSKNVYKGDGTDEGMMQYLDIESKFIHLEPGLNTLGFDAESGAKYVNLEFTYQEKYQGV